MLLENNCENKKIRIKSCSTSFFTSIIIMITFFMFFPLTLKDAYATHIPISASSVDGFQCTGTAAECKGTISWGGDVPAEFQQDPEDEFDDTHGWWKIIGIFVQKIVAGVLVGSPTKALEEDQHAFDVKELDDPDTIAIEGPDPPDTIANAVGPDFLGTCDPGNPKAAIGGPCSFPYDFEPGEFYDFFATSVHPETGDFQSTVHLVKSLNLAIGSNPAGTNYYAWATEDALETITFVGDDGGSENRIDPTSITPDGNDFVFNVAFTTIPEIPKGMGWLLFIAVGLIVLGIRKNFSETTTSS